MRRSVLSTQESLCLTMCTGHVVKKMQRWPDEAQKYSEDSGFNVIEHNFTWIIALSRKSQVNANAFRKDGVWAGWSQTSADTHLACSCIKGPFCMVCNSVLENSE